MELDYETSRLVAKRIKAKNRSCYYNAVRGLWHVLSQAVYVEGYAVTNDGKEVPGMVIEHGWLEHRGMIVDPTLLTGVAHYVPGLRFTSKELTVALENIPKRKNTPDLPIWFRFGYAGTGSREMMTAAKLAYGYLGYDIQTPFDEP